MAEDGMTAKIIEMANRDYYRITEELSVDGKVNTGLIAAYMFALFKVSFANMEKAIGIEKARKSHMPMVDSMVDVMIDGAYDKENDKIKG